MGFDPGTESANRYDTKGFAERTSITLTAYAHTVNSGLNSTACPNSAGGKGIGSRTANDPDFVFNSSILSQAHEANMEFMAAAGGNIAARFIDPLNPPQSSILTINQKKVLVTPKNGY